MIISNDFELRRFIPNVMSTVEGESSLYEKIEPYMGLVEASLSDIFIGPEMLANPRSMPETLRNAASVYVACLLYTSPSPRDAHESRMPSSA